MQPPKKRLKGVTPTNRYEVLPIDDDSENTDESDEMDVDDFPTIKTTKSQPKTKNPPVKSQLSQKATIPEPPPKEKIPPIVLHQKEKWTNVSQLFSNHNISFVKAKTSSEGIRITLNSSDGFRAAIKILNQIKAEYHTYQLPSEKLLHVVPRGVPEPIPESTIKEELELKGFHPETTVRLRRYKDKTPMPLVLITVPKTEKHIFHLEEIAKVIITVESQHSKARVNQCFRCQRFGHAQSRCTIKPRCVKCAGEHHYTECEKIKESPPKCANCGENHTASYRG